jgi:phosphoadenosine phosphosulfate reductase
MKMMDEKVADSLRFIREKVKEYERIATVCSFGKDSMVMQHLVNQVKPDILVLWIKPPFLPKETVKFAYRVIDEWNLNVKILTSDFEKDREYMENVVYKPKLWKTNPELCCQIFKVQPVMKAVHELDLQAWFSGLRRTESEKRSMYRRVWKQGPFVKLHPILDFTEADIWRYTAVHRLPVHPWYGLGYRSLGCESCSFPNVWSSERGGRWKDTMMEGGDCGIHCTPMKST